MIIEQNNQALRIEGAFRVYGAADEFKNLIGQLITGAQKIGDVGWVEVSPSDKNHEVKIKVQDPKVKDWIKQV